MTLASFFGSILLYSTLAVLLFLISTFYMFRMKAKRGAIVLPGRADTERKKSGMTKSGTVNMVSVSIPEESVQVNNPPDIKINSQERRPNYTAVNPKAIKTDPAQNSYHFRYTSNWR